ncbi:hypothetical protein DEM26_07685 [Thioclava sp. NG1]|uniref:hypothetical protein n=1 Tax=Thioclava sp. NG1 TaxID=2182426 RepID=UPI000D60C3F0|nr:hypothetical protein [Thioclava sp. NG1]PWE50768.1 hypothetical protein DEM26_07685 [Thioclava sp. NG1]
MSPGQAARAAAIKTARSPKNPLTSLQSRIDRIHRARTLIAKKIKDGELWLLPLLKRFNDELATLEETQGLLLQAVEIANNDAAPHRAA